MKVLADECVDFAIVARLRADGHDVAFVAEDAAGATDSDVLSRVRDTASLLITSDKDFGELAYRLALSKQGVLLLRLHGLPAGEKAEAVSAALSRFGGELVTAFSVLSPSGLRVRPFRAGSSN